MKKICSIFVLLLFVFSLAWKSVEAWNTSLSQTSTALISVDILKDGITASNAWLVMSEKVFTTWDLSLENLKFTVVKWAKISLNKDIKKSFESTNKTRLNFNTAKLKSHFNAKANYEDKVIEYPDRVRIITKTKFEYNNKTEYDIIFSGAMNESDSWIASKMIKDDTITQEDIHSFIAKNPSYAKYSTWFTQVNKKDIIERLTQKVYEECLLKNRNSTSKCKKTTIKNNVENELNAYRWTRTVTETIDINKIPLIYDADKSKDFTQRLKDSNISKEPKDVRISKLQIKNAFAQYTSLSLSGNTLPSFQLQEQTSKAKSCDWLTSQALILCQNELNKLKSNNSNTNEDLIIESTLLNWFTLWESYSYTLSDSYSLLWFTVYDIWVSFYAWYGVGIRIPIDVKIEQSKDRLEKWVSENYNVKITADTAEKDQEWFQDALWDNKAFDWKEAVLEAWAYARWWIELFEQTVFNEQIWWKKDWWKDLKIPFWNKEKYPLFSWIVEWNDIWLEVILYWVHISWDLKVDWYISWDLTYQCRTLASQWLDWNALNNCKNLDDTFLKDKDIPDIIIDPETKSETLNLKWNSEKYYYKNSLWVYQKYWVELQRFKYKPDLNIDLSLRWKVWVDTWDYFGWFWLETPWLKVYTFELDLPTLQAHSWYSPKSISTYENSYLYNFSASAEQDVPEWFDDSTKNELYDIISQENYNTINWLSWMYSNTWAYAPYLYGWKIFPNSLQKPVYQTNIPNGYYIILTQDQTKKYHGSIRDAWEWTSFFHEYIRSKKSAELEHVTNNVWSANNNVLFYYSNATNAIWGANLGWWVADVKKLDDKVLNDTKILSLPWSKCSDYAWALEDRWEDCPVANKFNLFWGFNIWDNNTLWDKSGMTFPYKKFNFTFHPKFNHSNNIYFAYIAHTNNKEVNKVKIYNKWSWWEIEDSMLWEPTYLQINEDNSIIIIYKEYNNSSNTYSYKIQKYSFNNSWESQRLYVKAIEWIDNVTDFYYDDANKTVFVSALEKNTNWIYNWVVYAIRYNWIDNTPYKQKIYTTNISHEQFSSYFLDQKTWWDWTQSKISCSSENPTHTAISSINFDIKNKIFYINGYASTICTQEKYNRNYTSALQYVTKVKYDKYPVAISDETPTYEEETEESSLPPEKNLKLKTQDLHEMTGALSGTWMMKSFDFLKTPPTSQDPYLDEKLSEIHAQFEAQYREQIQNIDATIALFEKNMASSTDPKQKNGYFLAIEKLKKLRSLLIEKYWSELSWSGQIVPSLEK